MKRTLAAFAVIATALTIGALDAAPARADVAGRVQIADRDDRHDGRRHRHHKKHWHHGHHKKHWHHRHHKKRWRHRHGRRHHDRHWGGGIVLQFGGPPLVSRPCHVVHRDGYFYGRYARIGETLCYDRHGRAYVAEGSQFLVHYY